MDLDSTLCYCYHITKRKVVNFVKQTKPRKASQISECFGAGSGCGWCIPMLVKIHEDIVGGGAVVEDEISPSEYEALRKKYIQDVASGAVAKNRHGQPSQHKPASIEGDAGVSDEPFDYTSYFSRSRPDPDPDSLE